jgi:hypothetical protein
MVGGKLIAWEPRRARKRNICELSGERVSGERELSHQSLGGGTPANPADQPRRGHPTPIQTYPPRGAARRPADAERRRTQRRRQCGRRGGGEGVRSLLPGSLTPINRKRLIGHFFTTAKQWVTAS